MTLEKFDKYIYNLTTFFVVLFVSTFISGFALSFVGSLSCFDITVISLGITLVIGSVMFGMAIAVRENMLFKRLSYDRRNLLPDIELKYGDFEDGQTWTIVRRHKRWGKYDKNGKDDSNLINREGKYLLDEWCDYIMSVDVNNGEGPGRLYVLVYDNGNKNLVYCHGYNRNHADIVFDELVKDFGNLSYEYIKVIFTDGSVNYVKLNGGEIMFSENLPGGFGNVKK